MSGDKKESTEEDWIKIIEDKIILPEDLKDKKWSNVIGQKDVETKFSEIIGTKRTEGNVLSDTSGQGSPDVIQCLLYGPPGTGKTASAMCIANQLEKPFIELSITDFKKKYVGEGAGNFDKAMTAIYKSEICKKYGGSVLFIDEVDDILNGAGDITNIFLTWTNNDGPPRAKISLSLLQFRPHILLATNRINELKDNVKDRFNSKVFYGLPKNPTIRGQIFFNALSNIVRDSSASSDNSILFDIGNLTAASYYEIGIRTKGYSGRQIAILANDVKKAAKKIEGSDTSFYIKPFFKNPSEGRYILTNKDKNVFERTNSGKITSINILNGLLTSANKGPVIVPISMNLIRRAINMYNPGIISNAKMKDYMTESDQKDSSKYEII